MDNLPIVIVAPSKKQALKALVHLRLPHDPNRQVIIVGNGSYRDIEGLRIDRDHTFFVNPAYISWKLNSIIEEAWEVHEAANGKAGFSRRY